METLVIVAPLALVIVATVEPLVIVATLTLVIVATLSVVVALQLCLLLLGRVQLRDSLLVRPLAPAPAPATGSACAPLAGRSTWCRPLGGLQAVWVVGRVVHGRWPVNRVAACGGVGLPASRVPALLRGCAGAVACCLLERVLLLAASAAPSALGTIAAPRMGLRTVTIAGARRPWLP